MEKENQAVDWWLKKNDNKKPLNLVREEGEKSMLIKNILMK